MSWGQKCESFWNSPLCHEGSEALRVGVVARPQGALAHGTLFPVGSERSLPIGLRGEGVEMGTHLWTEGGVVSGMGAWGLVPGFPAPSSPSSTSRLIKMASREKAARSERGGRC